MCLTNFRAVAPKNKLDERDATLLITQAFRFHKSNQIVKHNFKIFASKDII